MTPKFSSFGVGWCCGCWLVLVGVVVGVVGGVGVGVVGVGIGVVGVGVGFSARTLHACV